MSLNRIEAEIDRYEAEIIDLYEGIQDTAEIVDLILAGNDTASGKSRRLCIVRKSTRRAKSLISLYQRALTNLEELRALRLGAAATD